MSQPPGMRAFRSPDGTNLAHETHDHLMRTAARNVSGLSVAMSRSQSGCFENWPYFDISTDNHRDIHDFYADNHTEL